MIEIPARAKINLGLEVIGRRSDGYHEVATILQEVDLADRLIFRPADDLHLEVDQPSLAGEANLVLRAARLLRETTGCAFGAAIHLEKRIPIAAGLGGGSSDAAATLRALNQLWQTALSDSDLERLAADLGSDVAFFIRGGTALATGRGEILETLPSPRLWAVLVLQPVGLSDKTRRLYQALRPEDWSSGAEVRALAARLRAGRSLPEGSLPNAFRRAAAVLAPGVADAGAAIQAAGGGATLCGAGPTVLSLYRAKGAADAGADFLRAHGFTALVVATIGPSGL